MCVCLKFQSLRENYPHAGNKSHAGISRKRENRVFYFYSWLTAPPNIILVCLAKPCGGNPHTFVQDARIRNAVFVVRMLPELKKIAKLGYRKYAEKDKKKYQDRKLTLYQDA